MGHRGRLVLVPCPYQGHFNPMLQLGTFLQSNGFSVTVVLTKCSSPIPLNHPNLTFLSIPDGLSDRDKSSGNYTALILALNVNCLAALEECLTQMMKYQQPHEEIACIIYDELLYFSEAVANRVGLPSVIFRTNNAVTYLARGCVFEPIIGGHFPLSDFAEMAWGLASSKHPFLWVVRPGSVIGSEWIESLTNDYKEAVGNKGCIVQWAPQKQVLRHDAVGVFWIHCGWNSTLESICEGVPMICRPIFGDQKVTARYVSDVWRVGVRMENKLERGEIERTIRRLMVDEEGEETRQRAIDLKNKVEACTREGGSSYNSMKKLVEFIMSLKSQR
ncbi:hypothetical protein GH714_027406 [Hevea brasiliensis]|uniref:Anthocyanidin 3-O-glucosyltransferase n=1 Tax=Hevea brasiliensis TaxID=3981 RepID=A0A6A6ME09_HEVBR|nr:hypothetical protein GH714_027406 [Hevea brasiliensis]